MTKDKKVIVATRCRQFLIFQILCLLSFSHINYSMVWDNRYFPWFDQLYTGSDSRHAFLDLNGFFIKGGEAYRLEDRAVSDEQIIWYPELWGELKLAEVGASLEAVGCPNPIPADWQWLSDMKCRMPATLEGQGMIFSGYTPVIKHIGIGGSALFMKLNAAVAVVPDEDTISKLQLTNPGNAALFTQTVSKIYQEVGITSTAFNEIGVGDVVVFVNIYDTHEYRFKFRKLDWGVYLGIIIPCGLQPSLSNLAAVPFGGGYGAWGWFLAPRAEFELRDDLKFGIQGRFTQRFDNTFTGRIPIAKEQPLFAPVIGSISVDADPTWSLSAYFAFEELRAGFGVQAKYTLSSHDHDIFNASFVNSTLRPKLSNVSYRSEWTQEYGTIRIFYDVSYDKSWDYHPILSFSWDFPMNHMGGKGFARTNRIMLGCNFNF